MWWLFFLLLALLLSTTAWAARSLAPWVPTWQKDLPRIFHLAAIHQGDIFYDLGCGNGKVVLYAAEHYPVKQACGIELSLPLWFTCVLRRQFSRNKEKIRFRFGSLFRQNLHNANVIYVFGMPERLQGKLLKKFQRELQPGTRVISYTFPIAGLTPKVVDKPTPRDISIYLYVW